jgi:hypothetical protein
VIDSSAYQPRRSPIATSTCAQSTVTSRSVSESTWGISMSSSAIRITRAGLTIGSSARATSRGPAGSISTGTSRIGLSYGEPSSSVQCIIPMPR